MGLTATQVQILPLPNNMENYLCIGDIHGRVDLLDELLKKLDDEGRFYANGNKLDAYKLVFMGDMIDRGPDSYEVVKRIKMLCDNGDAIALLGNHDAFALDFYNAKIPNKAHIWLVPQNGGHQTVKSYGKATGQYGLSHWFTAFGQTGHAAWLRTLPMYHETDKVWFSHAPIPHENWRKFMSPRDGDFRLDKELLLWSVNHHADEGAWEHDHGKLAVCGHVHALQRNILEPRIYPHIVYADTGCGCAPWGPLTAIIVTNGKYDGYIQAVPKEVNTMETK